MSTINNDRVKQDAQEPNARVGDNQADRVPTHEGSQLESPKVAGEVEGGISHLNK